MPCADHGAAAGFARWLAALCEQVWAESQTLLSRTP
jgi:hypothetical protein